MHSSVDANKTASSRLPASKQTNPVAGAGSKHVKSMGRDGVSKENALPGRTAAGRCRAPPPARTTGADTNTTTSSAGARRPLAASVGVARSTAAGGSRAAVAGARSAGSRGRAGSSAPASGGARSAGGRGRAGSSAPASGGAPSAGGRGRAGSSAPASGGTSEKEASAAPRPGGRGGRGRPRPRGLATVGAPPLFTGEDQKELHPAIVKSARRTGQLNLSNKQLENVPEKVWHINEIDNEEAKSLTMSSETDERWWDQVPLTKLLLPGNQLSEISEEVALLSNLHTLDLHDNALQQLPAAMSSLEQLQRLVLSHNQLRQLPAALPASLRQLLLDHNQLVELPEQLGDCLDIELLDVSHNSLTSLPASLGYLHKVTSLNASNNQLTSVPAELGDMTSLRQLELSRNRLQQLPAGLGQLAQLETLHVNQNQLLELPQLASCRVLKELHAGYNQITEVSADVLAGLQSVMILDLSNNHIENLPDEVTVLQRLERLDLRNNSLSVAPTRLCLLPVLKSVQLEGNAVRSLRGDLLRGGTQQLLKHFRERLRGQAKVDGVSIPGLEDEPDAGERAATEQQERMHQLYKMKNSRMCAFTGQKAAEVPALLLELAEEAEVTSVDFSQNLLTALPDRVLRLEAHLSELNLSANRLSSLPAQLGCCGRLKYLNVSGNQLSQLPDSFSQLQQLREVVLSTNRLALIPSALFEISSLEVVLIADNQVAELDWRPLARLPRLATLDLRNNSVPHVPPKLGTLTQLRSLSLEGNLFKQPRAALLAQGTVAVLQYLRDRIPMAERDT